MPGSRNDALERREHLTAVADTKREAVGPGEEPLELLTNGLVEENGFRPPLARAQHIAVGESTARDEPLELL
jgi:hypothetical protein